MVQKCSLKIHFATTKPKAMKNAQNLGSVLTIQQSSLRGSQLLVSCVGFSSLLRSIVRILQCYWIIWEKDCYPFFGSDVIANSFASGPIPALSHSVNVPYFDSILNARWYLSL